MRAREPEASTRARRGRRGRSFSSGSVRVSGVGSDKRVVGPTQHPTAHIQQSEIPPLNGLIPAVSASTARRLLTLLGMRIPPGPNPQVTVPPSDTKPNRPAVAPSVVSSTAAAESHRTPVDASVAAETRQRVGNDAALQFRRAQIDLLASSATQREPGAVEGATGLTVIYIGGAGDTGSQIVESHAAAQAAAHPSRNVEYFTQGQVDEVTRYARERMEAGDAVAIVAHSWGTDDAERVARNLDGQIALLAGLDPVSKPGLDNPFRGRADSIQELVHVDAVPQEWNASDYVEAAGLASGGGIPRTYREADTRITVDANHDDFGSQVNAPGSDGLSVADRLDALDQRIQSQN